MSTGVPSHQKENKAEELQCQFVKEKLMISSSKGAFTLARFRGQFRTKLAHLVMKKNIFLNKNVLA